MDIGKVSNIKGALIFAGVVLGTVWVYRNVIQPKIPQAPVI